MKKYYRVPSKSWFVHFIVVIMPFLLFRLFKLTVEGLVHSLNQISPHCVNLWIICIWHESLVVQIFFQYPLLLIKFIWVQSQINWRHIQIIIKLIRLLIISSKCRDHFNQETIVTFKVCCWSPFLHPIPSHPTHFLVAPNDKEEVKRRALLAVKQLN